jgi:hypothetical protein
MCGGDALKPGKAVPDRTSQVGRVTVGHGRVPAVTGEFAHVETTRTVEMWEFFHRPVQFLRSGRRSAHRVVRDVKRGTR